MPWWFFNYANYAISHLRIIPEALNKVMWRVDTLLLFCFVAGGWGGGGWREDSLKKKKCDLQKKAKFNTSYLITSWILRCNWIRCIKPTLLFPSVKHKFSTMWHISVFIITCTCIIMSLQLQLFPSSDDVKQAQEKTVMGWTRKW